MGRLSQPALGWNGFKRLRSIAETERNASSRPRAVRFAVYALIGLVSLHTLYGVAGVDFGLPASLFEDWIYNVVLIGSALVCVARAATVREERLAWALIGAGLIAWSAADVYYTLALQHLEEPPFPSISDVGWLLFYPALWAAVVLLIRRRVREFHPSLWLDGLIAALGMTACVAAIVLPPIISMSLQGEPLAIAVNLAYPVGDVLLVALLLGALALTGWRPDRSLTLLGVGVALSAVAEFELPRCRRARAVRVACLGRLVLARVSACHRSRRLAAGRVGTAEAARGSRLLVLPLGAMVAALVLLFVDHFDRITHLAAGLAFATLLVAGVRLW